MGNGLGFDAFFGFAGVQLSISMANFGAGYGMWRSGAAIAGMGQRKPQLIVKNLLPVIMASILGIYGMIVSIILVKKIDLKDYNWQQGYKHFGAGLSTGFSCLVAGVAIGMVGDWGVRGVAKQPKLFVALLLILIFAEAIGLYGMIMGIIIATK